MKALKNILLIIWQLPQIIIGIAVLYYYEISGKCVRRQKIRNVDDSVFANVMIFEGVQRYAFALGCFIFVSEGFYNSGKYMNAVKHESGHVYQSMYLGVLYLLVIGIPSLLITWISSNMAKDFYTEKWADAIMKRNGLKKVKK
jgi:hypothetical protein